jgi:hypothetical protein
MQLAPPSSPIHHQNRVMAQPLSADPVTCKKLEINLRRNRKQDHTELLDQAGDDFNYEDCRNEFWNPESFSLLHGTAIWEQSSTSQRILLNQLYWVAYYSQIISAEIATIFFNQTSAAGLYGIEGFRSVCDMLDLESAQERAHIGAFRKVIDQVEHSLFGEPVFSYPMRSPYAETMIFRDTGPFRRMWKGLQLRAFGLLSSGNAFVACQYFLIRGLRTLSGKLIQHQLSQFYKKYDSSDNRTIQGQPRKDAPIPSQISYYHFCDESYHFNSSTILSHDVVRSLRPPTAFEKMIVNLGVLGCQRDHFSISAIVRGIFWNDPSAFQTIYRILRSSHFGMDESEALHMLKKSFCEENDGIHQAAETHATARESYIQYLADLDFISPKNRAMATMGQNSIARTLRENGRKFAVFSRQVRG